MNTTWAICAGRRRGRTAQCLIAIAGLTFLLMGCTGSTGSRGATGATGATGPQGPSGPTGPVTALNVTTAQQITATITSVSMPTPPAAVQPVVKFTLVNEVGQPLSGLPASDLYLAVAKLVPPGTQLAAVPPQTAAPAPQVSSQWQSYIYTTAKPAPASANQPPLLVVGTAAQPQATIEFGGSGTFVDNGDGTYQYTFAKDISKDPAVTYDATLTHRVGFEIRGVTNSLTGNTVNANSPVYEFQPSTGATTNITTRDIVADTTCTQCHQTLAFHGGARTEVKYCVVCHNPSSIDPSSGNSLDFKVMFHKIHRGADLPSVTAGGNYYIFGYMNSISDYSKNVFPTEDTRTCYTCHNESNTATPQTVNWRTNPSSEACGSCHDDVNFTTGANHNNIGNVKDTDCITCHGPNATVSIGATPPAGSQLLPNTLLHVDTVHTDPVRTFSKQFAYEIQKVDLSSLAAPKVTFTVTDPTVAGHVWNVLADKPFTYCSGSSVEDLAINFAWTTSDYTNTGTTNTDRQPVRTDLLCGKNPAGLPVANGDGSFTSTLPAIPAAIVAGYNGLATGGNVGVLMDGFPINDFGLGQTELAVPSLACGVTPATAALPPSGQPGAAPTACGTVGAANPATEASRREIVSVQKCDSCHDQVNFHGNHRVDSVQACSFCHNPEATDYKARQAATGGPVTAANAPDGANEQPIDLKFLVHRAHFQAFLNSQTGRSATYVVYHRGNPSYLNNPTPFSNANAGATESNNCNACHGTSATTGLPTYYLPDPTTVIATTVVSNSDAASPAGKTAITPGAAACYSCHVKQTDILHMTQNGGNLTATKDVNSQVVGGVQETCNICHGPGAIADVKVVHTGIH